MSDFYTTLLELGVEFIPTALYLEGQSPVPYDDYVPLDDVDSSYIQLIQSMGF